MDKEREIETTECKLSLKAIAELNSAVVKEAKKQAVREFAEDLKNKMKQRRQKYIEETKKYAYMDNKCYSYKCAGKAEFATELQSYIDELLAEVTGK